jgi:hypothetical protein
MKLALKLTLDGLLKLEFSILLPFLMLSLEWQLTIMTSLPLILEM